jgi:hypothetical protein
MSGWTVISGLHAPQLEPVIRDMEPGGRLEGAELWSLNDYHVTAMAKNHRPARIFNLHNQLAHQVALLGFDMTFDQYIGNAYDEYAADGVEIWLSESSPRFPYARIYPYEEVKTYLRVGDWFFSSSIAYMIALAIAENRRRIAIRKVQLEGEDEYRYQALGLVYAMHLCDRLGIETDAPMRLMWEQRFTQADLDALETGAGAGGIYRMDIPYHILDRPTREWLERSMLGKNATLNRGHNIARRNAR